MAYNQRRLDNTSISGSFNPRSVATPSSNVNRSAAYPSTPSNNNNNVISGTRSSSSLAHSRLPSRDVASTNTRSTNPNGESLEMMDIRAAIEEDEILQVATERRVSHIRTSSGMADDTTTSSASSARSSQYYCLMSVFGILLLLGIALVIIGAIITPIVNNQVTTSVNNNARIDPSTMSASSMATFMNSSSAQDFYLYNLTNLFAVLTTGAVPNFNQVKIVTSRVIVKYNVSWDIAHSQVTYNQLTSYIVDPAYQYLLSKPIIGVNPFYMGLQSSSLSGSLPRTRSGVYDVSYTYLKDSIGVAALFGAVLLPALLPAFMQPSMAVLTNIRTLGIQVYIQVAMQASGSNWPSMMGAWASAQPGLSAANPTMFTGFELVTALQTPSAGSIVAGNFFSSGPYGILNSTGLIQWVALGILAKSRAGSAILEAAYELQSNLIASAMGIATPSLGNDIASILAWIASITTTLPTAGKTDVGSGYQAAFCAAIAGSFAAASANPSGLFATAFGGNGAGYVPSTWADIGALQFGSGLVIALGLTTPTVYANGQGASVSDGLDPTAGAPFNFGDGAAQNEPMEFVAGLKYYVTNNPYSAAAMAQLPASQSMLWTYNPALLYVGGTSSTTVGGGTFINLNILQTQALFSVLLKSPSNYGLLLKDLSDVVNAYGAGWAYTFQTTHNNTAAVIAGSSAAYAQFGVTAQRSTLMPDAGVTVSNYYAVFTYLYNYLGNEMSGTLLQLDPSTGIAPQNSGLFIKRSVNDNLFGYTSRFGAPIEGVSGALQYDGANWQAALNADYKLSTGRLYVTDTGHNNISTVGQWKSYLGTSVFQSNCDLIDPARAYQCKEAKDVVINNFQIWGAPVSIAGMSNGQQIAPMGENVRSNINFYLAQAVKSISLMWSSLDYAYKGITLSRYILDPAVLFTNYVTPNANKNSAQFYQGSVPDGLFSVQTAATGIPAVLAVPMFGGADASVSAGITCEGVPCQSLYNAATHATFLDVEPLTGLAMRIGFRLQAAYRVSAREYYTSATGYTSPSYTGASNGLNYHYNQLFANGRETMYIPLYWTDVHTQVNDDDAATVRSGLSSVAAARQMAYQFMIGGIVVGGVVIIISIVGLVIVRYKY